MLVSVACVPYRGAMAWSVICDCGISMSLSLGFGLLNFYIARVFEILGCFGVSI